MRRVGVLLALMVMTSEVEANVRPPIEIKVEVTEVDNNRAARLGVDWFDRISIADAVPVRIPKVRVFERTTALQADLDLMIQEGAAELLANPNLITDSGTQATFQAGGQIPYVTSAALGSTHVEFKSYGVALKVQPTLLSSGEIRLKLQASVSSPDQTNGVMLSGNTVPALLERDVTSNLTVPPGATVALAGLVQTHQETVHRGVPLLRRIPLLGALFRWKHTVHRRTTIVMFVTPTLVDI